MGIYKMLKNKKSKIFNVALLVGTIIVTAALLMTINTKLGKSKDFIIGSTQGEILKTYQLSQKILLYTDQSAKYSAYQSIYELAKKGGCNESDDYLGYSIWGFDVNSKCSPDKEFAKKKFIPMFSDSLNNFLLKYESIKIPLNFILSLICLTRLIESFQAFTFLKSILTTISIILYRSI